MAGQVSSDVKQRDLLGAAATAYRAAGWLVVSLHLDKTNPRQQSGPDLLCIRDGQARAVKVMLSGDLTTPQDKVRLVYEEVEGFTYVIYRPEDFLTMAADAGVG